MVVRARCHGAIAVKIREWIQIVIAMLALVGLAGSVGVWAGDQRWVVASTFAKQIEQIEINALDRQITFLQIKINENEATKSERIYIESLKQQLRALQN